MLVGNVYYVTSSYNETKLGQGRDALKRLLDENPELCEELYEKIMNALNNSNQDF